MSIRKNNKKEKDIYDFENNTDDVHYIDWDDDLEDDDENDETGPWEEYNSTRPYGYNNDGY